MARIIDPGYENLRFLLDWKWNSQGVIEGDEL